MSIGNQVEKIAKNADLLAYLFTDSPVILYSCKAKGDRFIPTFASSNTKRILGYDSKEFIDNPDWWSTHIHPEDRLRVFEEFPIELIKKGYFRHTYRFERKNGTYVWVQDELKLYRDKEDNPSHIVGIWIDVTEQKKAEKALKESENLYRTLVETLQEGMTIVDPYENIIFANSFFCDMLGYSREEIVDINLRSMLPEKEYQKVMQETDKRKKGISSKYELIVKRKDGELRNVIVSATPLINEKSEFQGTIGLVMDITERKRVENKLKQLNETLRLTNEIMRHDIFNDLQIVNASLGTYAETKDETFLNKSADHISKSIALIGEIRELESLVTYRGELVKYSVKQVVEDVIKNYSVDFKVKGNCITLADEAFHSIIDNIIRNAIVHGKTDKIDITIGSKDNFCEIRIADYGIGIPDAIKEKVFKEGFSYGESGGTGLGLYIVKETVGRYGGDIHVEDNKPKGAVFVIKLKGVRK